MTTIVSCFYKLSSSKHSIDEYDKWIRNFVLNINANLCVFTSSNGKEYLTDILKNNVGLKYHIIVKEINDYEIFKKYPNIWKEQEQKDPNKKCGRKRGCYILWNSKFDLLKEAIELNPFNSDKFIWNDIGNIRDERIVPLLKNYPNANNISDKKIDIVVLQKFNDLKQKFFQEEVHLSGSMFGGHKDTIMTLHKLYYNWFQEYLKNDKFIGCDQQILSSLVLHNFDLFNVIFPVNSKVDVWFYLYQYYANKAEKIGFYFNCYKNKHATDKVLESLRSFYPNNPVFLMNDHGDNFEDIAEKYNCVYHYSSINLLGGRILNGKKVHCFCDVNCANEYLKIIAECINKLEVDYLILIEDDVLIKGLVTQMPEHSGGSPGMNLFKGCLKDATNFNFIKEKYPLMKCDYWNQAGGSIIHCQTLSTCINNTKLSDIQQLDEYCKEGLEFWHTNDILLGFILAVNGKKSEKWTNTTHSNIVHPYKGFYKANLGIEDGVFRK